MPTDKSGDEKFGWQAAIHASHNPHKQPFHFTSLAASLAASFTGSYIIDDSGFGVEAGVLFGEELATIPDG